MELGHTEMRMRMRLLTFPDRTFSFVEDAAVDLAKNDPRSLLGAEVVLNVALKGVPGQGGELLLVKVLAYSESKPYGRFAGRVVQRSHDYEPGQSIRFQAGDLDGIVSGIIEPKAKVQQWD